jgi:hypothetical protein
VNDLTFSTSLEALRKRSPMNKIHAIRWLIEHRRADVPLRDMIDHLRSALSFDAQSMALLQQVTHKNQCSAKAPRLQDLPRPRNLSRGFWGTLGKAGIEPAMAWPIALLALMDTSGEPLESISTFLDSRMGEQFARAVMVHTHAGAGIGRAVRLVTDDWMARPLDEIARLVYRLDDLPFLVGWIRVMQST